MGFIVKIIESIIPNFISDFLKERILTKENVYLVKSLIFKKHRYFNELRNLLTDMPFIYKDFDADVLKDFQSIEFRKRDSKQFVLIPNKDAKNKFKESASHKFKDFVEVKKLLFVGSAGVGKSTQMRHIALSIINFKKNEYFKSPKELIPIFIQLKGIEPNKKSPIISYILNDIILFKGKNGLKRFQEFIDKKRIVLILDGYDEIQIIGDEEYIKYEISLLLSFNFSKEQVHNSKITFEYLSIYKSLCENRVYLTTREEFYGGNILENFEIPNRDYIFSSFEGSFQAVVLSGLGVLRYNYVKTIFDKYINIEIFRKNLNAELFIHEIDMCPDDELRSLSQIPLYLTIMCFIYIDHIRNNLEVKDIWNTKMDKLIYECITTLLESVDKSKVGEIKDGKLDAWQEAFMKRRSDYSTDKLEFLEYYSFDLLLKGESIFGYANLKKTCIYYFQYNSKSKDKEKILTGLQKSSKSSPDIAWQLINSSIFTTVCLITESYHYDFPHRRFKDVLATKFIEKNDQVNFLIENSHNKNLFDFIIYFYSNCESDKNRECLMKSLLDYIPFDLTNYYNELVASCIKRKKYFKFEEIFFGKLTEWIEKNADVKINSSLINSSIFTYSFITYLHNYLDNCSLEAFNSLNLILNLIYKYKPDLIEVIQDKDIPVCKTLLGNVVLIRYKILVLLANKSYSHVLNSELNRLQDIQKTLLLASLLAEEEVKKTAIAQIQKLTMKEKIFLASCLEKLNPDVALEFKKLDLINEIIFEAYTEVLKHESYNNYTNSAFYNSLNSRLGHYNSQLQKNMSSNDKSQKALLTELSSYFDSMSDNHYRQFKATLNYVSSSNLKCLDNFIIENLKHGG